MSSKLSLVAKILIGVLSIVAVAAIAIGAIIVVNGSKDKPLVDDLVPEIVENNEDEEDSLSPTDIDDPIISFDFWESLTGYWISEGSLFAGFFFEGDDLILEYGLLQSGYWMKGDITNIEVIGDNIYSLSLHIPASPATMINDAVEERVETVLLDISSLDTSGTIDIKIENSGEGNWHTYEFYGGDLTPIGYTAEELFSILHGYWYTVDDEDNPFIGFFNAGADYIVEYGIYQTWFGFKGELIDCQIIGNKLMQLTVYFPVVTDVDEQVIIAERTEIVYLDMNEYDQNAVIKVNIAGTPEGDYITYFYAGETTEEAYANWPLAV